MIPVQEAMMNMFHAGAGAMIPGEAFVDPTSASGATKDLLTTRTCLTFCDLFISRRCVDPRTS